MRKKTIILGLLALSLLLGGCKRAAPEAEESSGADTSVITETELDDLEDGGFYILKDNEYEKLYVANANYEIESASSPSDTRTLWFQDDWAKIPTMYTGDSLVYKSSQSFDELFYIERFEYVGWTIGVSNLKEMNSGRYSASTDPEDLNINQSSDAMQLTELSSEYAVIDRIGGIPLRSGNISSGGCILGLTKGGHYAADVYEGTILRPMILTADSIALTSMEAATLLDYDYMQSQIITIHIPEYYNSGYYLINGFGLVRYIAGDVYDADTDFNIPNVKPEEKDAEEIHWETADMTNAEQDPNDQTWEFTVEKPSMVIASVYYSNEAAKAEEESGNESGEEPESSAESAESEETAEQESEAEEPERVWTEPPKARIVGNDYIYELELDEKAKTLSLTQALEAGDYVLEIMDMDGRPYMHEIRQQEAKFSSQPEVTFDAE